MLELNTPVKDKATEMKGMLTHVGWDSDGNKQYLFQPKGLNEKTRLPLDGFWLESSRVVGGVEVSEGQIPRELLNTVATDRASGFKGMVVGLVLHINGCVHAVLKAKGTQEDGEPIKAVDLDIRRLEGDKVPKLTEQERKVSHAEYPGPAPVAMSRDAMSKQPSPLTCLPNPCDTCPYRRDTAPGIWDREEYDKLPQWDDPLAMAGIFMCHNGDGQTVCRGWFEVHQENLHVRAAEFRIKWSNKNKKPTQIPLYSSGGEARAAGLRGIRKPGRKALAAIIKIVRRRK